MKALPTTIALVLSSALAVGSVSAQSAKKSTPRLTPRLKEEKAGLLAQATVTPDSARRIALARVANGRIAEQEIEMEDGKLVYSFDIKVPARRGIEEVQVDAKTGAFVKQEHEGPKAEAAEKAGEARDARKARRAESEKKEQAEKAAPRPPR